MSTHRASLTSPGPYCYGARALAEEADGILHSVHGARHNTVFHAARRIGQLVAGNEIDEDLARSVLVGAARTRGLPLSDAERQVDRGLTYGARRPRRAPRVQRDIKKGEGGKCREWALAVLQAVIADLDAAPGTKKIAAAIVCEMIRYGRYETTQSYRQIAELAGVSVGTVWNHSRRLRRWLRWIPGKGPNGGKWRLRRVSRTADLTSVNLPDPSANCWYRRAGEWLAYGLTSTTDETSFEELAAHSGRALRTIRADVERWAAAGLAVVTDSGVTRIADAELPDTAIDHAARRRASHVAARVRFKRWLAEIIAERHLPADERDRRRRQRKDAQAVRNLRDVAAGRKPRRSKPVEFWQHLPAAA